MTGQCISIKYLKAQDYFRFVAQSSIVCFIFQKSIFSFQSFNAQNFATLLLKLQTKTLALSQDFLSIYFESLYLF